MKTLNKRTGKSNRMNSAVVRAALFESLELRQLMSTYYLATNGSDSGAGSSAAPFASFNKAYTTMKGGDTLIVKNGTYNQQSVLTRTVRPPSGSAGAWTVVKAETPGGVVVDGKGTMSPISMDGPANAPISYIQIDGMVFRHQAYGAALYDVDYMKFTRDGFEDASDGNSMVFNVGKFCSNILVEDSFAWGSGRYKFATYHAEKVIFRRLVARFDRAVATPDPMAVFVAYASDRVEMQNCISIDGDHPEYWINADEYAGSFSIPSTDGPSTNINITGSIALNVDMQFGTLTKNLTNINISNSVGWHIREGVLARDSANYDHMTLGDIYGPSRQTQTVGLNWVEGDDPNNTTKLTNSILFNIKGVALSNWSSENYNDFYGNNSNRNQYTPTGANSITANPSLKYILSTQGASSAIIGKGSGGTDIGANITKRIGVTGTLWGETGYNTVTGEDLWPWPNEDIIGTFMRSYQYQNLSGNRGFAATGQTLTNYVWNYLGNGNPYGSGSTPTAPTAPSSLTASASSATAITISWTDNSTNEDNFILERQTGGGAWTQVATLAAGTTTYSNTGLTASTAYSYRVMATNSVGDSSYSNTASATTQAAPAAPAAPSSLASVANSATSVTLTWTDNSNNETSFLVERQIGSGAFSQIGTVGSNVNTYTDTTATANTQYSYRVRASNTTGNSSYTSTSTVTTPVAAPTAPSTLSATASSATAVSLTWADNSSNETGFLIERKTGSGAYSQIASVSAGVNAYSDTTVSGGTSYTYRVRATNAGGNSTYSNTSAVTTPVAIPGAPSGLTASAISATQITLAWVDNSSNETGFLIERQIGSGAFTQIASVAAGLTTYNDTAVSASTLYGYRVRANNTSGNSNYSNTATATTPVAAPVAPSGLTATASSATQVVLSWTDNAGNETGFLIERKTGSGAYSQIATVGQGVVAYTDTTVSANTAYTYRVRATNAAGNSSYSNTAAVTTPQVIPATPTGLGATATGPTAVDLDWSDSSSNETGFLIERKTGAGSFVQIATVGSNVTSYTNSGLTADTDYVYRIRATNAAGNSAYSSTVAVTTPAIVIAAPSALNASLSGTTATLTWSDNSNNETGFLIERKTAAGSYTQIGTVGAGVETYTNSGLANDTQYTYRVRATNGTVTSDYSNTDSVTTAPTLPTAPSALTATANDATQVDLSWTDNSSNETSFVIERKTGSGEFVEIATVAAGVESYGDTTVSPNTIYQYRVYATNAAGNSATAIATSVTTPDVSPTAPSDLAAAVTDSSHIVLTWSDNSNNETGFVVERLDGSDYVPIATVDAGITTYSDTGLPADTDFTYRVRALNEVGPSAYSNAITAHTAPPEDLAGNSVESAMLLGNLQPGQVKVSEETVGTVGDRYDMFEVNLITTTTLMTKLVDMVGDADLQILDANGNRLAYAKHSGASDENLSRTLAAGKYFVRVLCTSGLETSYRLRVETALPSVGATNPLGAAPDLGTISKGVIKATSDQVGVNDRNDLFKFNVTSPTTISAKLMNLTDDADLMILNSAGERIAYSRKTGSSSESLSIKLPAGTYYVRVLFTKGTSSTNYRLRLAGL